MLFFQKNGLQACFFHKYITVSSACSMFVVIEPVMAI